MGDRRWEMGKTLNLTVILILCLYVYVAVTVAVAIPWPIRPADESHSLSGTYGDARGNVSSLHFHMAVDIPAPAGTKVYCIKPGYIIAVDADDPPEWIQIGDARSSTKGWSYSHLANIPLKYQVVGARVDYGACIGEVMDFYDSGRDHLDFRLDSKDTRKAFVNPVEVLDPSPPEGDAPVVDEILFRKQEEGRWFTRRVDGMTVIGGNVDIIARAYNPMGEIPYYFSPYSPGIYKIEYEVTGYRNIAPLVLTTFTGVLTRDEEGKRLCSIIYDNDKTAGRGIEQFYYTVTNTNYDRDQCWNTKSKSAGVLGNGVGGGTANTNKDAYFRDGEYTVKVRAYGWHGDTGEKTEKVLVDNFYPCVEATTPAETATDVPVDIDIVVTFDENMKASSVERAFSISPMVYGTIKWSEDGKTMTFVPDTDLKSGVTYTVTIQSTARDVVGKQLDGDSNGYAGPAYRWSFSTTSATAIDTREPQEPYPSISGTHYGTIKPNETITVSALYTYPCAGTGGHTEYVRIWNATWAGVEASWDGYPGNGTVFDAPFKLFAGEEYNYEIITGSYPQIHHRNALLTANGWINCSLFVDANGQVHRDWIPAIKLA